MITLLLILIILTTSILPVERSIVDSPVECAAGWNRAGELVFEFCSDSSYTFILTEEQSFAVVGGTVTHNHPEPGCWVLSPQDMRFAQIRGLDEMRAVSRRDNRLRVSIVRHAIAFALISDGIIDQEARSQLAAYEGNPDACAYLDATWRALAQRYDFSYEVIVEVGTS